jgi:hypothetical protein
VILGKLLHLSDILFHSLHFILYLLADFELGEVWARKEEQKPVQLQVNNHCLFSLLSFTAGIHLPSVLPNG